MVAEKALAHKAAAMNALQLGRSGASGNCGAVLEGMVNWITALELASLHVSSLLLLRKRLLFW